MATNVPSTPGSVSNIAKLLKSSPDGSINPGQKKKSKGVGFNATCTPQRVSGTSGAQAVTPTSPPKLQNQHRSQAGNDVWADDVITLISVTDSLSVAGGSNKSNEKSSNDNGGIDELGGGGHNNNNNNIARSDGGTNELGCNNNSNEESEVGRNNNSNSGLNTTSIGKHDDNNGGIRGIVGSGGTDVTGSNNNSKETTSDATGAISDLGHNNTSNGKHDDDNGGISGIGRTGGTDVTENNNNSKETTVDATGAISDLGHNNNSNGNGNDDVVMTDIPGATGKGGNNKFEIIDLQDSDDDAKPAAAEDFLTARKKKMDAANAAFQENFIYKYYPDGAFPPTEVAAHWKTKHNRIWSASPAPKYYYSKKDGNDKKSVHDMIVKHVAHPFSNIRTDVTWRNGELVDFLKLATACFEAKEPWTNLVGGQELRICFIGLSRMSPERFEPFYIPKTGNLLSNPETRVWVAANTILGSTWRLNIIPPRPLTKKAKLTAKARKSLAFAPDTITAKTLTGTL